jgi:nitrous oxidase accessory protein
MKNEFIAKCLIIGIILCFGASVVSADSTPTSFSPQPMTRGWLYVGGTGEGNHSSIQEAIENATNGDTIFVYNKTYNENIDTKLKKITILGEDHDTTIIKGVSTAPVVRIGTSDTTISTFTILGTPTEIIILVASLSENVLVTNNLLKDGGYGISLAITTSKVTISGNTIVNNAFSGIQGQTTTYNVIKENIIENNGAQGIFLALGSHHNSILNNSIKNNGKEGLLIDGLTSKDNTILGNDISGNQIGIRFTKAGSNKIQGNNIEKSIMEGALLQSSNENTIEKNNFIDNKRQATFRFSSRNTWDANYWSNWIGFKLTGPAFQNLPKFIIGGLRINTDKNPAKTPYNISLAL